MIILTTKCDVVIGLNYITISKFSDDVTKKILKKKKEDNSSVELTVIMTMMIICLFVG